MRYGIIQFMLKIGVSGVRGIVGESLTEEIVRNFASAFGTYLESGKVVVGTDSRPSKEKLKSVVFSGLNACGCETVDIGLCPTPTIQLMVRELKARGGIAITASHNPIEWNGLKFIREDGIFLNEKQAQKLINIYENKNFKIAKPGQMTINATAADTHLAKILNYIDVDLIKKKKFKIALDSCNGAGSIITVKLLAALGCQVIPINTNPDLPFPHPPEPIPENLSELCKVVKGSKADIGFAQDPDADRLSIVSEKGEAIGEEYSLALATEYVLSKLKFELRTSKFVVTNLSTSKMIDDIAVKYGAEIIRTKIGEVHVAEKMKEVKAVIGGEGNGGIIVPEIGYARDSLAGMAVILEYLTSIKKPISSLAEDLPKYYMIKDKFNLAQISYAGSVIEKVKEIYKNENLDAQDGVKVCFKDGWIHVRPSGTEPILRIIVEGKNEIQVKRWLNQIRDLLSPKV